MSDTTQQAALRANLGAQFANIAFNWAQKPGYMLSERDCEILKGLQVQWDAARSAAPDPAPDLHGAIMNLPCAPTDATKREFGRNVGMLAYKLGHRDARHAAAELVSATPADKGDVGLLEALQRIADMAPATCEMSLPAEMAQIAQDALRQRLEGKE